VAGQVATIVVTQYLLGIGLPLVEMVAVLVLLGTLNVLAYWRYSNASAIPSAELFIGLVADVFALTAQLYLSGGASNPFISLFLLHVILAAILLELWSAVSLAGIAGMCFLLLSRFFRPLELHHSEQFLGLHLQGMFICFVLTAGLLLVLITRISRNLNERDAHLADLRQRSIEEDHVVRLGLLATGAAHELGTPLATLSVILNDWRRLPVFHDDAETAEELGVMETQLERCKTIVSGILMSSGEVRGEGTVRTTVRAFLDELVGDWRSSRSFSALSYSNSFHPDVPIIWDTALKQVLVNVFDNAMEASPESVDIQAQREGDNIVIVVSDKGRGIPDEILNDFGKPYRSTKGRPGGGLGLFLVMNVLRKLGGTVTAHNHAEGGAVVKLSLPLAELSLKV
jgi:two-component system sensor histidine kinase RegB